MQKGKVTVLVVVLLGAVVGVFSLSLFWGAADISFQTVVKALTAFDAAEQDQQIIRNIRLPRLLADLLIGGAFAAGGCLIQGVTRNSLADSGLLGINGGAALGLALSFVFFPAATANQVALFSFLGALGATLLIFCITQFSQNTRNEVGLILAGIAISGFFQAVSQGLGLYFNLQQDLAFWFIGGTANVTWQQLMTVSPLIGGALLVSWLLTKEVNILLLGEETAISLGRNPAFIRASVLFLVMALVGGSVSLVGPVSFIGLVVPHVMRHFSGSDYRLLLPLSFLGGALLVLLADFVARMVNPPFETPFGILLSVIGVPFLLYRVWQVTD